METLEHEISNLQTISEDDVQVLWKRYSELLELNIRWRMKRIDDPAMDEGDLVSIAFFDTVAAIRSGAFPKRNFEADFWPLLLRIAQRHILQICRSPNTHPTGSRIRIYRQSELEANAVWDCDCIGIRQVSTHFPDPEFVVEVADVFNYLLERASDDKTREIVMRRLVGDNAGKIAEDLGTTTRRVYMILSTFRPYLEQALLDPDWESCDTVTIGRHSWLNGLL